MNIPKIKLHIYKNDANEKPIKKIGNITVAHIEDMQKNISQEKDVTEHMKNLNEQWFDSISLVSLVGDEFNKEGLNETT
jgi:dihydroxyacetone kinase-like predicted kinase